MEAGFTGEVKKVLLAHGCEDGDRGVWEWTGMGVWGSLRVWGEASGEVLGDDGELLRRRASSFPAKRRYRKLVKFNKHEQQHKFI